MHGFVLWTMMLSGVGWAQRGQVLKSPEKLAGRWEAPDGEGGAVGMNIHIYAHAVGAVKKLQGEPLYLDDLSAAVYRRTGVAGAPIRYSFFSDDPRLDLAMWDGKRLLIRLKARVSREKFDIDMIWDEREGTWTGHFGLDDFLRNVVLRRPKPDFPRSPFAGTWFNGGGRESKNCLHVAQQADGGLTAWVDALSFPGNSRYANGLRPPVHSLESYGEIANAKLVEGDMVTVEVNAYSAGCCSRSFTAKISADGRELVSSWREARPSVWKKMPGDSCVAAAPGLRP